MRSNTEFEEAIRKYLSDPQPDVASERTSFREDFAINLVMTKLTNAIKGSNPTVRILDVGCGEECKVLDLLKAKCGDNANKLAYQGIDIDHKAIQKLKSLERSAGGAFEWHDPPKFRLCDILDYPAMDGECYEIILFLNSLHEMEPRDIPRLLEKIVSLLAEDGTALIIDMERLPPGKEEAIAICFEFDEIRSIIEAAGLYPTASPHEKSVPVFYIAIDGGGGKIERANALAKIRSVLEAKVEKAVQRYCDTEPRQWNTDSMYEWILTVGSLARLKEALRNLDQL